MVDQAKETFGRGVNVIGGVVCITERNTEKLGVEFRQCRPLVLSAPSAWNFTKPKSRKIMINLPEWFLLILKILTVILQNFRMISSLLLILPTMIRVDKRIDLSCYKTFFFSSSMPIRSINRAVRSLGFAFLQ